MKQHCIKDLNYSHTNYLMIIRCKAWYHGSPLRMYELNYSVIMRLESVNDSVNFTQFKKRFKTVAIFKTQNPSRINRIVSGSDPFNCWTRLSCCVTWEIKCWSWKDCYFRFTFNSMIAIWNENIRSVTWSSSMLVWLIQKFIITKENYKQLFKYSFYKFFIWF